MKTNQFFKILIAVLLFQVAAVNAQGDYQKFWIHEDHVKPSKLMEYEGIMKEMVAAMQEHNIQGSDWLAMSTSDFRYAYISAIDNMAALDGDGLGGLPEKMGKEAFGSMMERMNECYSDHTDYVLTLDTELSYMPDGMTQTPEGMNYRENGIYYFSPANFGKALELGKKFKELYAKKESPAHYRVYRSGFGSDGTFLMVAVAAKDAADLEATSTANQELLGEEFQALRMEMLQLMESTREMKGWIRADLGYTSTKN